MSCAPRLFIPVWKGRVTTMALILAGPSHRGDIVLDTQEHTGSFLPTYAFVSLPTPSYQVSVFQKTDGMVIATLQIKTSPIFCIGLNAPRANLQAYLYTLLGNSKTRAFSWNIMEVKGKRWETPILNDSAENALPPDFPLCQRKPF